MLRRIAVRQLLVTVLLLILLTIATASAHGARPERVLGTDVGGHITENTTWTLGDSPIIVTNSVTVDEGVTLTIDPGVLIKSNAPWINIFIHGTLRAEGSAANPIVFTSIKDDDPAHGGDTNGDGASSTPAAGDWGDINFSATGSGSLEHVWVGYGGENLDIAGTSEVTVRASTIAHALNNGIYVVDGSPTIEDTEFRENADCGIKFRGFDAVQPIALTGNTASVL